MLAKPFALAEVSSVMFFCDVEGLLDNSWAFYMNAVKEEMSTPSAWKNKKKAFRSVWKTSSLQQTALWLRLIFHAEVSE